MPNLLAETVLHKFLLAGCITFCAHTIFALAAEEDSRTSTTDPRCPATFDRSQCPSYAYAQGLMDFNRAIDPTSCTNLDNCPRCLVGPEWETKLKDLGLGTVARSLSPWVLALNWLSHEVITTLTMILLREALGFDARGAPSANQGNTDFICCGEDEVMIDMERWLNGDFYTEEGYFTTYTSPVGYTGTSSLFIPSYTLAKYPMANAYNAYKYLPEYSNIFPKAMSTNCSDMLQVKSAENIENCDLTAGSTSAFVCDVNPWTNTTCVSGHYVPPQCQGANAEYCQELYMTDPYYDTAMFEAMIKNNNLNFTASYIGATDYPAFIKAKHAAGEDFFFYWYSPDPLSAAVGARAVNFDPVTPECTKVRTSDPTTSQASCGYPVTTLLKYARRDVLKRDADFKFFFESFSLTEGAINALLAGHSSGSGNQTVYDLSCSWIQNNFDTWAPWIRHTTLTYDSVSNSASGFATWTILVPVLLCFVAVLAVISLTFVRRRVANRHAPKSGPLAILFTDVESSTTLWELCGNDMKQAMRVHNEVIRKLISEYQAYEVKTNGDSFMIACKSLTDATLLSLAIQTALNDREDIPNSITEAYETLHANDVSRNEVANGLLRVKNPKADEYGSAGNFSETPKQVLESDAFSGNEGSGNGFGIVKRYRRGSKEPSNQHCLSVPSPKADEMHQFPQTPELATSQQTNGGIDRVNSYEPPSEHRVWNGLRVRIGLHWCSEVSPQLDAITQRYDFFGHDVNVSARVEGYACGGQVVVQEDTYLHLTRSEEFQVLIAPDCLVSHVAKAAELKGVQGKVGLWSLIPLSLRGRAYKPLAGVELPDGAIRYADGLESLQWDQQPSHLGELASTTNKNFLHEQLSRHGSFHSQMSKISESAGVSYGHGVGGAIGGTPNQIIKSEVSQGIRYAIQSANQVFLSEAERSRWLNAMADKYRVPRQNNAGRLAKLVQSAVVSQYLAMHQPVLAHTSSVVQPALPNPNLSHPLQSRTQSVVRQQHQQPQRGISPEPIVNVPSLPTNSGGLGYPSTSTGIHSSHKINATSQSKSNPVGDGHNNQYISIPHQAPEEVLSVN